MTTGATSIGWKIAASAAACGMVAIASEEEPFCTHCGAQLSMMALPWPLYQLVELESADEGEAAVEWEGLPFALVLDAEAGVDAGELATQFSPNEAAGALSSHGLTYLVGQRSDVGAGRAGRANEDSIFTMTLAAITDSIASLSLGLYLVADGMGGHLDGQVASRTACEVISAELFQSLGLPAAQGAVSGAETIVGCIEQAIQQANQEIYETACTNDSNMGTTVVLALAANEHVYLANVGDSRRISGAARVCAS
ncbi:MAG: protein phosphatase 2C domain-containing protein [Anaerolineales bacterium]|nr:protein phosphatase 2C domain-containing protein [Anaerolineales bacterium]